jgi:hypothetical protein
MQAKEEGKSTELHIPAALPCIHGLKPNSFGAYIVIHKIHLMNLKNAATLVPDAAR